MQVAQLVRWAEHFVGGRAAEELHRLEELAASRAKRNETMTTNKQTQTTQFINNNERGARRVPGQRPRRRRPRRKPPAGRRRSGISRIRFYPFFES